ncbi:hypothetical protein [Merdimmobilis hominis]|jgi:hypothetical protein|uniref:Uncharacterized protein n=1 Tax=uncultured Anaerotruncus sp. TaxID=905011 RepID=A0A6N2U2Z6_9FIRM|nr:hypothetical protein [Merdimmobilis hominis]MCD4835534.1 hypothetical protein [Merdimmobilis hominis]PWL62175.1 MAG: hypothetical protein DBY34_03500 [Oscillospiraceae bacterium]
MPSSQKTAHLSLNSWSGADKPKMDDFNADNLKLDAAFHQLTPVCGSYVGDGKITRAVDLGFRPKICLVYTDFVPLLRMNPTLYTEVQIGFAILSEAGCSMGASLTDTGISVRSGAGEYDYEAFFLNSSGQTYYYIAFR